MCKYVSVVFCYFLFQEGTEHNTLTQSFSAESCSMSEYYDAPEAIESQSDTTSEVKYNDNHQFYS